MSIWVWVWVGKIYTKLVIFKNKALHTPSFQLTRFVKDLCLRDMSMSKNVLRHLYTRLVEKCRTI